MTKPHIKVIQRNGVDVFVTSSMEDKLTVSEVMAAKWRSINCEIPTIGQRYSQEMANVVAYAACNAMTFYNSQMESDK